MFRIVLITIFLSLSGLIPFYYYDLVRFSLIDLHMGWVFGTFFLRLLVIVFFVISLNLVFSFFRNTRKIKFPVVFLIGMIPGFGISCLLPIDYVDYGDWSDEMQLEVGVLSDYTENNYPRNRERHIVAFFNTACGHCINASFKLGINQLAGQKIKVYAFFAENDTAVRSFIEMNNGSEFLVYQIANHDFFVKMAGFEFPSIFLINGKGSTLKHWNGDMLNFTALDYIKSLEP